MTTKQANELNIGETVIFGKAVVYVRSIEPDRVRVSKRPEGLCVLSIPFHTSRSEDLMNRVELVA